MSNSQPDANPIKLAGRVAANVELQTIALRSLIARFEGDPLAPPQFPPSGHIQLSSGHQVAWQIRQEERFLDVRISFSTQGKEKATNLERLRVDCELTLRYVLSPSLDVTEEHFKHFANLNAVVNAWPYYREAVQNCISRMGLPTLVLPLYRLPQKAKALQSTSPDKEKGKANE